MRFLSAIIPALLLLGTVIAAPTSKEDDTVTIDNDFYPQEVKIYTANHTIVDILVPLNDLNFGDDDSDNENEDSSIILFFTQAEVVDGKYLDQGLYLYKHGKAKLLLEHGRESSASNGEGKNVYFAAKEGLFVYNDKTETADKYGNVEDDLVGIAKENGTDGMYVLTSGHEVYKVSEDGNVKTKIESIPHANQIVLDFSNNLYFYGDDNVPYVYDGNQVRPFEGLPSNLSEVRLLRPAFLFEDSVLFVVDDKAYMLYANGTAEITDFVLKVKPTAYGMEAGLVQYFALGEKLYEYNILLLLASELISEMKDFLDDKKDDIQSIATRSLVQH